MRGKKGDLIISISATLFFMFYMFIGIIIIPWSIPALFIKIPILLWILLWIVNVWLGFVGKDMIIISSILLDKIEKLWYNRKKHKQEEEQMRNAPTLNPRVTISSQNERWRGDEYYFNTIAKLLDNYVKPDKKIIFITTHKDIIHLSDTPVDVDTLRVYNWANRRNTLSNNFKSRNAKAFFCSLDICHDSMFQYFHDDASRFETVIKIGDLELGAYNRKYNCLWLFWDASHESTLDNANLTLYCFKYLSENLSDDRFFIYNPRPVVEEPVVEEESVEPVYNKIIPANKVIVSREHDITEMLRTIDKLKKEICDLTLRLAEKNRRLKDVNLNLDILRHSSPSDIEIHNVMVKDIEFTDDGEIVVYTHPLFIEDLDWNKYFKLMESNDLLYPPENTDIGHDGIWDGDEDDDDDDDDDIIADEDDQEDIPTDSKPKIVMPVVGEGEKLKIYGGQYKIVINMRNLDIRFFCLDNDVKGYWSSYTGHPHVNGSDGIACMGDLSEMLSFASSEGDFSMVIDLCVQFLRSANVYDSAGSHVIKWDLCIEKADGTVYNLTKNCEFVVPKIIEVSAAEFNLEKLVPDRTRRNDEAFTRELRNFRDSRDIDPF